MTPTPPFLSPRPRRNCSDSLIFLPGVVELSFLLGVFQDGVSEGNEYFDIFLHQPWGGARLGAQHRTRVTVVDVDGNGTTTDPLLTGVFVDDSEVDGGETVVVAGIVNNATLVARDTLGGARRQGGDVFVAWVEGREGDTGNGTGLEVRGIATV